MPHDSGMRADGRLMIPRSLLNCNVATLFDGHPIGIHSSKRISFCV